MLPNFSTINQHSTLMNSKAFGVGTIVKKNSRLDKQIFICHGTGKIPLALQGCLCSKTTCIQILFNFSIQKNITYEN
jgi:hypothetical protein